ncbi:MAG: chorismate synthase [Lachnospiraceae bacterium]|jgi:chorismate synthase
MAGSTLGTIWKITTWGESHGAGVGVVIDGCPAGLPLTEEDVQAYLDRRKPGQSRFTTQRQEGDKAEILSGVFEGRTTGTPIAMFVRNQDQRSKDYSNIMDIYRPGHADYTFDQKYGFRDYRGGGRSSGRETIGRVAAGAVAAKFLESLGITIRAFSKSIGPVSVSPDRFDWSERDQNRLYMPDAQAAKEAEHYLEELIKQKNSAGGVIQCEIDGLPTGIGEPVFDKLSASLAKAVMSIGAVKGFEIGDGFQAAASNGKENNDSFFVGEAGQVLKKTNHSGGVLGGISDGSKLIFRAAFKPTPSIAAVQETVNRQGQEEKIEIRGRHDPIIVPRAVVVVEAMAALTIADLLLVSMTSRLDRIQAFFAYSEALAEEQEEIIEEIQGKQENESYENCNGK